MKPLDANTFSAAVAQLCYDCATAGRAQLRFVTARELRNKAAGLWEELSRERQLVVTVNGHPVALITEISEQDLEETLRVLRRTRAQVAAARARRQAHAAGLDKLTNEDIEKEIQTVRGSRKG